MGEAKSTFVDCAELWYMGYWTFIQKIVHNEIQIVSCVIFLLQYNLVSYESGDSSTEIIISYRIAHVYSSAHGTLVSTQACVTSAPGIHSSLVESVVSGPVCRGSLSEYTRAVKMKAISRICT